MRYNRRQLAHVWANQFANKQTSGKTSSGNFYFEGHTIYSYGPHFPIARFVTNKKGARAVLFTWHDSSMTTKCHMSMVRQALHGHIYPIFYVADPSHGPNHKEYLNHYKQERDEAAKQLSNKRKKVGPILDAINCAIKAYNRYAEFFGLSSRLPFPAHLNRDELEAKQLQEEISLDQSRQERKRKQHLTLEARRKLEAETNKEKIERWLNGEKVSLSYDSNNVLLRIVTKNDKQVVETSLGAEVPLDHAIALLPLIRAGEAVHYFESSGPRIGLFRLNSIDEQGNITVGCHKIKRDEIERIAQELKL